MTYKIDKHPVAFRTMSIIAILFGIVTIKSGGMVLFTEGEAHQAAGNYVPFVLWFNFVAGFIYVTAGIGLWLQRSWTALLTLIIAFSTLLVFSALGEHICSGGAYEVRTIWAMSLRSIIWIAIALITYVIGQRHHIEGLKT